MHTHKHTNTSLDVSCIFQNTYWRLDLFYSKIRGLIQNQEQLPRSFSTHKHAQEQLRPKGIVFCRHKRTCHLRASISVVTRRHARVCTSMHARRHAHMANLRRIFSLSVKPKQPSWSCNHHTIIRAQTWTRTSM